MFSSKYGTCQSGSISATPSAEMNSVEMTFAIAVIPSVRWCRQVDRRNIQSSSAGVAGNDSGEPVGHVVASDVRARGTRGLRPESTDHQLCTPEVRAAKLAA